MAIGTDVKFTVNTEVVNSAIYSLNQKNTTLRDHARQVINDLRQLQGATWTGSSQQAFQNKVNEFEHDVTTMYNRIEEETTDLKKMVDDIETTERTNVSSRQNKLDGSVVN